MCGSLNIVSKCYWSLDEIKLQLNSNKKEQLFIQKSHDSLLQFYLWMGGTSLKKQVHNLRAHLKSLAMLDLLVKTLFGRLRSSIGAPVASLSTVESPVNNKSSCLSSLDYCNIFLHEIAFEEYSGTAVPAKLTTHI